MPMLATLALSAALLATAPGQPEGDGESLSVPQAFTMVANVLGAATACEGIEHGRLSAAARQVGPLATADAPSLDDVAGVEHLLMISALAGRQAVEKGLTDCATVQSAFGHVEQMVLQIPVALRKQEPVPAPAIREP